MILIITFILCLAVESGAEKSLIKDLKERSLSVNDADRLQREMIENSEVEQSQIIRRVRVASGSG